LDAARSSMHPDAQLVAWFSSSHLLALRSGVAGLWSHGRELVKKAIEQPGNVGWRARGELVEWQTLDGSREEVGGGPAAAAARAATGEEKDKDKIESALEGAAKLYGCVEKARLAGPFGHIAPTDHRVHFEAERAGPWPLVFPQDPR